MYDWLKYYYISSPVVYHIYIYYEHHCVVTLGRRICGRGSSWAGLICRRPPGSDGGLGARPRVGPGRWDFPWMG